MLSALELAGALRAGPATLDALRARLGGASTDEIMWALNEAVDAGWASSSEPIDCGPDGLCSTSAPTIATLTAAGRERLSSAGPSS